MLEQALLTATVTLIGAVVLFIFSEITRGLIINPILELRSHTGVIVDKLIYCIAELTSGATISRARSTEISQQLRAASTQLRAKEHILVCYPLWSFLGLVPTKSEIDKCARNLIGLSNSFRAANLIDDQGEELFTPEIEHNIRYTRAIQEALRLKVSIVPADID